MTAHRSTWAATFAVMLLLESTVANWWMLGMHGSSADLNPLSSHRDNCLKLNYLAERQQQLCGLSENVLTAISTGARLSIDECQHQFRNSRWNCSTFNNSGNVFGGVLSVHSRETAFIYAISAAGVAYAVTRACSRGELNECSCDSRVRVRKTKKKWQWGGCSEDIRFGEKFSRDFVDSKETGDSPGGLMNLHNNEAGRRSIRSRMERVCKCHGMSGSCSVRVCWRKLPPFRVLGEALAQAYEGATQVRLSDKRRRHTKSKRLRAVSREIKPPNRTDLVYLEESPDYCERNDTMGIPGTKGRVCNRTSPGLDGCRLLCCGRGHNTRMKEVEEKCQCKFVWCCKVQCQTCRVRGEEHTCK
ncbi:WntA [Frankliniella occidentalis]|uniref:Protein Wnt n=1 Tax=Frankliniella occidentalis TaxID=133901 RepID=A0A6J1T3W0_FRAOC|nr:protein Wnt-4-like [Frankliniella occidentalis]KAE8753129.1 WntA [Frankliniella occidentalis]